MAVPSESSRGFLYSGAVQDQDGPVHWVQGGGDMPRLCRGLETKQRSTPHPTVGTARHNDESTKLLDTALRIRERNTARAGRRHRSQAQNADPPHDDASLLRGLPFEGYHGEQRPDSKLPETGTSIEVCEPLVCLGFNNRKRQRCPKTVSKTKMVVNRFQWKRCTRYATSARRATATE